MDALPADGWIIMEHVYAVVAASISDESAKASGNYSPSMKARQEQWSSEELLESGRRRAFSRAIGCLLNSRHIAVSGPLGFTTRLLCRLDDVQLATSAPTDDIGAAAESAHELGQKVDRFIRQLLESTPDAGWRGWKSWRLLNRPLKIASRQLADANRRLHYLLGEQGLSPAKTEELLGASLQTRRGE